jgi:hypothetical protein
MSSPVSTAITSPRRAAADVSIDTIVACASGERTIATWSMPGTPRSSM